MRPEAGWGGRPASPGRWGAGEAQGGKMPSRAAAGRGTLEPPHPPAPGRRVALHRGRAPGKGTCFGGQAQAHCRLASLRGRWVSSSPPRPTRSHRSPTAVLRPAVRSPLGPPSGFPGCRTFQKPSAPPPLPTPVAARLRQHRRLCGGRPPCHLHAGARPVQKTTLPSCPPSPGRGSLRLRPPP